MNTTYIVTCIVLVLIVVAGVYFYFQRQENQDTNLPPYPKQFTYPENPSAYSIYDLKNHEFTGEGFDTLIYSVEGYVVKKYVCPPCPPGTKCKPCMENNIVISENPTPVAEIYPLQDSSMIVYLKDHSGLEMGRKYVFSVRVRETISKERNMNVVELVEYSKVVE